MSVDSYEEVPYPGDAFPQTHPDRLATHAILYGMNPAPVETSRVLELGCGEGANLLSIAYGLPDARFVGIDRTQSALSKGQAAADALHLKNISFKDVDLNDPIELGQFDYIIAHGVYSWVPPPVRERILAICQESLAPQGVAYVSYNAYPGCHFRDLARGMMRYHVRQFETPQAKVREGKNIIRLLSESGQERDLYHAALGLELERLQGLPSSVLYHDDLEETSQAFYFHEFMRAAERCDLQFLAEAQFSDLSDFQSDSSWQKMQQYAGEGVVAREQYHDFLKNRRFRQTLLCHNDVALQREISPERVEKLLVRSSLYPTNSDPSIVSFEEVEFRGDKEARIHLSHPAAKAAFLRLSQAYPRAIPFVKLLEESQRDVAGMSRTAEAMGQDGEILAQIALRTYGAGVIELHTYEIPFASEAGHNPFSSALARFQLKTGTRVVNLRQQTIHLEDALGRRLITLLDGTSDRGRLMEELAAEVRTGAAGPKISSISAEDLETNLQKLARMSLLIA